MVIIQKMAANDEGQASGSADGPSVSSRPEDVAGPSTAVPNQAGTEREKRRMRRRELTKKRLKQLELKLAEYDRQIKKVTETELSLEEMNSSTSAYLMEDAIKRKFMRTWYRLCELLHMDPEIKISSTSATDYNGTCHPQINRRVNRLISINEFPDHFDVCQLIDRVNEKYSLGLSKEDRIILSRKIFKEVGEILQQRRKSEFRQSFGCHLTDSLLENEDPAISDTALHEQLARNAKEGEERLAQLCEEFAVRQETEGDATDTSGDEEAARKEDPMQVEEGRQSDNMPSPGESSPAGDTSPNNKDIPDGSTSHNGKESPSLMDDIEDDDVEIVSAIRGSNRQVTSPESNSSSDCIVISDSEN